MSIFDFDSKIKEECAHFFGYANWPEFQRAYPGEWAKEFLQEYIDEKDEKDKKDIPKDGS